MSSSLPDGLTLREAGATTRAIRLYDRVGMHVGKQVA